MKKFTLDSKSIALLGCFWAMLASTILRILVGERIFGAETTAFYTELFALSVQIIAFLLPAVLCAILGAWQEGKRSLALYNFKLPRFALLLTAGFSVCQYVFNFSTAIVWENVCAALGFRTFGPTPAAPSGLGAIMLAILSSAVLPAVAEEGVARGLAGRALSGKSKRTQILVSALFFALLHQSWTKLGTTFVGGIWLFWLYLSTGSITAPLIVHLVNNVLSVLGDSLGWTTAFQALVATPLGVGVTVALTFLAGSAMVGIIRLCEKRFSAPHADYPSSNKNTAVQRVLLGATLFMGVGATLLTFFVGVSV